MASAAKYPASAVKTILAHNDRQIAHPSNKDIDPSRSHLNYSLLDHGLMSPYDYYRARRQEVYCMPRKDVKPLIGWVLTAPQTLPLEEHENFFRASFDFVSARYGPENMVQAVVHQDESGQPHLHICFMPIVPDTRRDGEKICANDVLTRRDLQTFHSDWQTYLRDHGISTPVHTGVTARQGGNRTVKELKQARDIEQDITLQRDPDNRWSRSSQVEQERTHERGRW